MLTYESLIKNTERVAVKRIHNVLAASPLSLASGAAALQWACDRGHVDTFVRLIPHLTIKMVLYGGVTNAFYLACRQGHLSIVELVPAHLKAQAARAFDGFAVHITIFNGHRNVLRHLLDYLTAEDVHRNDNDLLRRLCNHEWYWAVRRLFTLTPARFYLTADDARFVLRAALDSGHVDVVECLFASGRLTADDLRDVAAESLAAASRNGKRTTIDYLLDHLAAGRLAADDLRDPMNDRPCEALTLACAEGDRPLAERMLEAGLDQGDMDTLLLTTCTSGHGPVAALLLAHGVTPTSPAIAALAGVPSWSTAATAQQVGDVLAKWDGRPEFEAAVDEFRLEFGTVGADRWDEIRECWDELSDRTRLSRLRFSD